MTKFETIMATVFVLVLCASGFQFIVDFILHQYHASGSAFTRVIISVAVLRCINRSVKQREDYLYPWRKILG